MRILLFILIWSMSGLSAIPLVNKYGNGKPINVNHCLIFCGAGPTILVVMSFIVLNKELSKICISNCK